MDALVWYGCIDALSSRTSPGGAWLLSSPLRSSSSPCYTLVPRQDGQGEVINNLSMGKIKIEADLSQSFVT